MKLIGVFIVIVVVIMGLFVLNKPQAQNMSSEPTTTPQSNKNQEVDITASFTIVTGTITRSFTAEKYHNQSPHVYIESSDPSIVHVKKNGITWDDFFKTLPMKLTKECLITGDGETLCDGKDGTLKFYLNDIEDKNLLDKEIQNNDKSLIKFTP